MSEIHVFAYEEEEDSARMLVIGHVSGGPPSARLSPSR
jgi:hypothetical protein